LKNIEGTLIKTAQDSAGLKDEIDNLNTALTNARSDHGSAQEGLEQLHEKFDGPAPEKEMDERTTLHSTKVKTNCTDISVISPCRYHTIAIRSST
jgi:hypothetical protein